MVQICTNTLLRVIFSLALLRVNSLFVTFVVDCKLPDCSVTCGGGTKQCSRTCENGEFGQDGCPLDEKDKLEQCNDQPCRMLENCYLKTN